MEEGGDVVVAATTVRLGWQSHPVGIIESDLVWRLRVIWLDTKNDLVWRLRVIWLETESDLLGY